MITIEHEAMSGAFTKEVALTPQHLNEILDYDHSTGILRWKEIGVEWFSDTETKSKETCRAIWNSRCAGKQAGGLDKDGYVCIGFRGHRLKAHRVAWAISYGQWPHLEIDHIDGCPGNNALSNLRLANRKENLRNTRSHKDGSSQYKGVTWHSASKKWMARLYHDGRNKHLGLHENEIDAATAYNEACAKLDSKFFRLNNLGEAQQ